MIDLFYQEISMNYELLRILIAILGTSIAAYFDIFNKKNIPDMLLYSFLFIAIIITFLDFNPILLTYAFGGALIIGITGYILYQMGQLGGADVFILCSLSLLLPVQPEMLGKNGVMNLPFIFSILSIAGIFFIFYVLIKFTPIVLKRKEKVDKKRIIYSIPLILIFLIFIFLFIEQIISIYYLILIAFLVCVSIYFSIFKERFMRSLIEEIPLSKIENEDVIAIEYMDEKLVKKYNIPKVISEKDLKRLKNIKISKYPVYTKLPMFVPFILIGLLVALYFGDIFYLITLSLV